MKCKYMGFLKKFNTLRVKMVLQRTGSLNGPWEIEMKFWISNFQANFNDGWPRYLW